MIANNPMRARAWNSLFTVASTVGEIFGAKPRNSGQRHANQLALGQL